MDDQLASALKLIKDLLKNSELTDAIDALQTLDDRFALGIGDELIVQSARHFENESARDLIAIDDYRRFKTQVFVALTKLIKLVEKPAKPARPGAAPDTQNQGATSASPHPKPAQPVQNQPVPGVPSLVVLYHIDDAGHALALEKQLKILTRAGRITVYFQQKEGVGKQESVFDLTKTAIGAARLVAILATEDFFFEDENFQLVEFAKLIKKPLVPILVKSFNMSGSGIEGIRALPSNNKFINTGWPSPDSAWLDIANGLRAVMLPGG